MKTEEKIDNYLKEGKFDEDKLKRELKNVQKELKNVRKELKKMDKLKMRRYDLIEKEEELERKIRLKGRKETDDEYKRRIHKNSIYQP